MKLTNKGLELLNNIYSIKPLCAHCTELSEHATVVRVCQQCPKNYFTMGSRGLLVQGIESSLHCLCTVHMIVNQPGGLVTLICILLQFL